jgi:thiol-disulfide isomerase/thioredoxin
MKSCFLILWIPIFCIGQGSASSQFTINGNITGVPEGAAVFVVSYTNTTDTVARGFLQSGKFSIAGHVTEPSLYEIYIFPGQKRIDLFFGNDNVSITGNLNDPQTVKISGPASNSDFMEFQQIFNAQILHLNKLAQIIQTTPNISKDDSTVKEYVSVVTQLQASEDEFLQRKKSSYVSGFMLAVLMGTSDDVFLLERRLNLLTPEIQNSFFGKYLRQQIATLKVGAVGSDEIDFTQNDTQGKPVSLSSFKGKYVLVDFWASWCHPCRLENPNVVAVYNKFKTKKFAILSVSLDKSRDPWLQAIKDDKLTWTHVSDLKFWNNDVALKYRVTAIPQNFLIDPNGKIVAKNLRGPDLESKLCEFLGCN